MDKYKEGDIVTGKVTGVVDYGIFLSFNNKRSGLVHISEISYTFVKNISDYVSLGDMITAKILSIEKNGNFKLSIKRLKKSNSKIVETDSGFYTLSEMLTNWISEYDIKR